MNAAAVEAHHRLRGGIPEDTIRALETVDGLDCPLALDPAIGPSSAA
jgi:hypothetical protein